MREPGTILRNALKGVEKERSLTLDNLHADRVRVAEGERRLAELDNEISLLERAFTQGVTP